MSLLYYKIFAAFLIFIISITTAIYPLKRKIHLKETESIELGEALASGIFLGAAFFHMLPDSIRMFEQLYSSSILPLSEIICVASFLFLLFLERLSLIHSARYSKNTIPYILALILTIHAFIEGAALGIGNSFADALMIFIAILAHKASESFALCVTMIKHQVALRTIIGVVIFFSLMTPLGIILGSMLNFSTSAYNGELIAAIFNAFAAGTFLYISTLHHVRFHPHTEEVQGLQEFAWLVAGVFMMGITAFWT